MNISRRGIFQKSLKVKINLALYTHSLNQHFFAQADGGMLRNCHIGALLSPNDLYDVWHQYGQLFGNSSRRKKFTIDQKVKIKDFPCFRLVMLRHFGRVIILRCPVEILP